MSDTPNPNQTPSQPTRKGSPIKIVIYLILIAVIGVLAWGVSDPEGAGGEFLVKIQSLFKSNQATAEKPYVDKLEAIGVMVQVNPSDPNDKFAMDVNFVGAKDIKQEHYEALSHFPRLGSLKLEGTSVKDDDLKFLSTLTTLQDVRLGETAITGASVALIKDYPVLLRLDLNKTAIVDDDLKHIGGLKTLLVLNLENTKIGDAGIKNLSQLTGLRSLNLSGTNVTDKSIEILKNMTDMQTIIIQGSKLTPEEVQKALPKARIIMESKPEE